MINHFQGLACLYFHLPMNLQQGIRVIYNIFCRKQTTISHFVYGFKWLVLRRVRDIIINHTMFLYSHRVLV